MHLDAGDEQPDDNPLMSGVGCKIDIAILEEKIRGNRQKRLRDREVNEGGREGGRREKRQELREKGEERSLITL
jgi:hypothetical protein